MISKILKIAFLLSISCSLNAIEVFDSIGCEKIDTKVSSPYYLLDNAILHIIVSHDAINKQATDINLNLRRSIYLGIKKFVYGEFKYSNFSLETNAALQRKTLNCNSVSIYVFSVPTKYLVVKKLPAPAQQNTVDSVNLEKLEISREAHEFEEYK